MVCLKFQMRGTIAQNGGVVFAQFKRLTLAAQRPTNKHPFN
jgi:hypothetical protein